MRLVNLVLFVFFASVGIVPVAHAVQADNFVTTTAVDPTPYYERLFQDDRLDIVIALGYKQKEDVPVPILGPLLALVAPDEDRLKDDVDAFQNALLECQSCALSLSSRGAGYRVFRGSFDYRGRKVVSYIRMIFPERGVLHEDLKAQFAVGLRYADVVIYSGHSRWGHGFPDFYAPFSNGGKVFVEDPIVGWRGFDYGYFSRKKYQILSISSCLSFQYYRDLIRDRVWEKRPADLALILTRDNTYFEDEPKTSTALIEGLIRGGSGESILMAMERAAFFYHVSFGDVGSDERRLYIGDGLLDESYVGLPSPRRQVPEKSPLF